MAPQAVGPWMEAPGASGVRAPRAESQVERLSPTQKLSQTRRAARWTRPEVSSIFQLFTWNPQILSGLHQDVTRTIGPPRTSWNLAGLRKDSLRLLRKPKSKVTNVTNSYKLMHAAKIESESNQNRIKILIES